MKTALLLTAFGTSTRAAATYDALDQKLRPLLTEFDFHWAYSSKTINRNRAHGGIGRTSALRSPEQILEQLSLGQYRGAVIQSLHLFPGSEFHNLVKTARRAQLPCVAGLPLFSDPDDFHQLTQLLKPIITARPNNTILILGHGTTHPSWTSYYCLEKFFQQAFGKRIRVGVVENYPDSANLVEEIAATRTGAVTIIPLFLVAGMHFTRDIAGAGDNSWVSRLSGYGMEVETVDQGIGLLAGIEKIIVRHINQAAKQLHGRLQNC
ncbi:sirohydrochlorin cobaltochelatase [Desulforhopalus singaporensis]|uniref:Sirohydrochlorin cobaltochelatase n=1 Tax=Desulforhopalus singaporensis TaxID=91360 RepID=A0A1H0QY68_9BACT|nr:sirohydrochlorin cobaltochelatase [Desulforhopalus singaporensis]SDP22150.1 sirohydrochlorin cobaltochelatase [Desulforhopalus singaporensis]